MPAKASENSQAFPRFRNTHTHRPPGSKVSGLGLGMKGKICLPM